MIWLAQYFMKNSEYAQAIGYYVQLLELYPDHVDADQLRYELGQAYEIQGAWEQALDQYKSVSPSDVALFSKVQLAVAGIFAKEFDLQKALDVYQNIVKNNPEYIREAYLKMAQLYRQELDYDKEIEAYQEALAVEQGKTEVTMAELLFSIADAYECKQRLGEAVEYYLKIPAQHPQETQWVVKAYLRVAKIFEDRKDWEGAKVTYQKVMQLDTEESKYAQERWEGIDKEMRQP